MNENWVFAVLNSYRAFCKNSAREKAVVNFIINSDFKWLLLVSLLPWAAALILYRLEGERK